jgi:phospholipase C
MKTSAPLTRLIFFVAVTAILLDVTACGGGGGISTTLPPPPPSPLSVITTSLPGATLGTAYSQGLAASGGVPPYKWAVSTGSLPAGVTLNGSTGMISGTVGGVQTANNFTVTVSDSQAPAKTANASLGIAAVSPIQHIVIIFQENRSPDNLFQDPVLISKGADIQNYGVNSLGQKITLSPMNLGTNGSNPSDYDIGHSHKSFLAMCDLNSSGDACAMDGADLTNVTCNPGVPNCPPLNPQFMYVNPSEVQPYFQMAEQYTFADRMFQTNQGPSFPAHQFIISGTSAPQVGSSQFVENNPQGIPNAGSNTGCASPAKETVNQIDPAGVETSIYPCFEHQTLTDLLEAANLTWRYYTPTAGSIWTGPNAIQHLCGPDAPPPNATACVGTEWSQNVVLEPPGQTAQVLTDIANGQLATVSWVIPQGMESDHPSSNDGSGPSWVASVVNAIGGSPYWSNTAILIAWDDWGGWYDHVAPPIVNSYEYGFRVPMIVVSPYAKPAYISHTTHDFGSILKFIEETFNLPSLGYADVPADDLVDCFNFSQTPLTFKTIAAPLKADYFLNDKRPPTDPDND